jgi:hypothetical protein
MLTLNISLLGGILNITWPYGVLEQADSLAGPWTTIVGATSPYAPSASAPPKFYRVRVN